MNINKFVWHVVYQCHTVHSAHTLNALYTYHLIVCDIHVLFKIMVQLFLISAIRNFTMKMNVRQC